jgi:hypothetical protein
MGRACNIHGIIKNDKDFSQKFWRDHLEHLGIDGGDNIKNNP